jgi:hypothetical protein
MLIKALYYDNIIKQNLDKVEIVADLFTNRLTQNVEKPSQEIWKSYACLLLKLVIRYQSSKAKEIIYSNFGNTDLEMELLFDIIRNSVPPDTRNDYTASPELHNDLFAIVRDITAYRFKQLTEKGIARDDVKDDLKIIDAVVQKLYFSLNDGRKPNKSVLKNSANKAAFFKKLKPILQLISNESIKIENGFMVAHTGYYFMQLLNSMVDADPGFVLSTASAVVKCASATGFTYDSSTLAEIVKLTESILADHKDLLSQKEQFDNLLAILDVFANSGWQEALELTWRLKEVF